MVLDTLQDPVRMVSVLSNAVRNASNSNLHFIRTMLRNTTLTYINTIANCILRQKSPASNNPCGFTVLIKSSAHLNP